MKDELGNRMKRYELASSPQLMIRGNYIIRIDGRGFSKYTRKLEKPFDRKLIEDLDYAAKELATQIQGFKMFYAQSDEISFYFTSNDSLETQTWYGGDISKIVSLSASIFTGFFNSRRDQLGFFDARVFCLPDLTEVVNYFVWRAKDCYRNAVNGFARTKFYHKELLGLKLPQVIEKIGVDEINTIDKDYLYGRCYEGRSARCKRDIDLTNGYFLGFKKIVDISLEPNPFLHAFKINETDNSIST